MTDEIMRSILDIIRACDSLQLATISLDGYPETRHVMNAMNKDAADLSLRFMTNNESPKYRQIMRDPKCCLYYFNPQNRHAVRLFGKIEIIDSVEQKHKFWNDDYKAYGYSGPDDENYALLGFIPHEYKFYSGYKLTTGKIR
ncbi:MAG: pyridoxamine 5'-phosphate oxidase family protein [Rickettsiales bacterium]|jgi:general stress protein 26|nr:pyridoxamine 5'-phosphate oxidase family protein [Rickettsiales bacterium]